MKAAFIIIMRFPPATRSVTRAPPITRRFCTEFGKQGLQLFVYGRSALNTETPVPKKFPARQTKEASESIARLHKLRPEHVAYAQQEPNTIDNGAFHNDVVSVGNQNVYFYHEQALMSSDAVIAELRKKFEKTCGGDLEVVKVAKELVPLKDAVSSYLFNSQLVTLPNGKMALIAPTECRETPSVHRYLGEMLAKNNGPIKDVKYYDVRQSMHNGGGPACLRLRVVLTDDEIARTNPNVLLNEENYASLRKWVEKHYRDRLMTDDLADPKLLEESRTALDELTQIMNLGSIYPFQR